MFIIFKGNLALGLQARKDLKIRLSDNLYEGSYFERQLH